MLDFDEENARRLEAIYTTPDIVDQRRAIRAALSLQPGARRGGRTAAAARPTPRPRRPGSDPECGRRPQRWSVRRWRRRHDHARLDRKGHRDARQSRPEATDTAEQPRTAHLADSHPTTASPTTSPGIPAARAHRGKVGCPDVRAETSSAAAGVTGRRHDRVSTGAGCLEHYLTVVVRPGSRRVVA